MIKDADIDFLTVKSKDAVHTMAYSFESECITKRIEIYPGILLSFA